MSAPGLMHKLNKDKKKLSIMLALLGVGLLLWGRLLLKQAPRTAVAAPAALIAAKGGASSAANTPAAPQRRVTRFDVPAPSARDLFALDDTHYARVPKVAPQTVAVEKSIFEKSDEEQRLNAVLRAASGLSLQSTIAGDAPRAVINGRTLAPGETVNGFTLREVLPRRVVLEMDGVQVRLDM